MDRARRGVLRSLITAAALAGPLVLCGGDARTADRLVPYVGTRYIDHALGFSVDLPARLAACRFPREGWREGIVLVLGGGSCDAPARVVAFVAVTGAPNTDSLGDVDSLAASICNHPNWGAARVEPARRAIAGRRTLSCLLQDENGSITLEAVAQRERPGPPATWTNLRVSLIAHGDRWLEFTRIFEDVIARVGVLPP